jgi:peptide chain release factor 2
MKELIEKIEALLFKVREFKAKVDLVSKQNEIKSLEGEMSQPGFWDDVERAKWISQKVSDLKEEVKSWQDLSGELESIWEIAKEDEQDQSVNLRKEIEDKYHELKRQFNRLETAMVLNGKYDGHNAVLSIYAGAGGDDAQDWAEMLLRMYLRFCEKKGWPIKILDQSKGGEAGLKSATLEIKGHNAYGYLKSESGVHRLVRLSPFDADKARHTSFAMVEVIPEIESATEAEIKDEDLKIEANTSTGHGGQGVNTTYSAIRITHLPTGIKVSCQNERSQSQNKETALKILKGKLVRYQEAQAEEERQRLRGEFTEAAWGNQIRSYVLHPYKMVKDHRTDYEEHDPDKVLGGELDNFIDSYLKSQIK